MDEEIKNGLAKWRMAVWESLNAPSRGGGEHSMEYGVGRELEG